MIEAENTNTENHKEKNWNHHQQDKRDFFFLFPDETFESLWTTILELHWGTAHVGSVQPTNETHQDVKFNQKYRGKARLQTKGLDIDPKP